MTLKIDPRGAELQPGNPGACPKAALTYVDLCTFFYRVYTHFMPDHDGF